MGSLPEDSSSPELSGELSGVLLSASELPEEDGVLSVSLEELSSLPPQAANSASISAAASITEISLRFMLFPLFIIFPRFV